MTSTLERAREAFDRHAWREAFSAFVASRDRTPLDAADNEHLAVCAYLLGEDDRCAEAWEAAHRVALDADDSVSAAHCAFWLALCLMLRGQMARASGWLARTERLIDEDDLDCATSGYLLIPGLLGALDDGDPTTARELAVRATEIGNRFADPDLLAFAILGHGQALIALGDIAGGSARLDEAMVSVTAGEVGPITSGIVYCAVILECMQLFDLQRASEWTDALTRWCDDQPDLVPYRGQCLVHRSQLQQAAGRWSDASATAAAACERLAEPPHPALGLAYYQEAELHRLVGAFDEAQNAYRQAGRCGFHPMPGLALLQLVRGDSTGAAAGIRRALQERGNPGQRPALLSAAVDIFRASGDLTDARSAAEELAAIAAGSSSRMLRALAAQAAGAVLVAEGEPTSGLVELRAATAAFQAARLPYEAARAAVLLGLACAAMGDRSSAVLEFDYARETFTELGAIPDLERLTALTSGLVPSDASRSEVHRLQILSPREREVLALVAEGKTNRQAAGELMISEHTVGRHMENIFTKLGVTSRAAAIARAYERNLL